MLYVVTVCNNQGRRNEKPEVILLYRYRSVHNAKKCIFAVLCPLGSPQSAIRTQKYREILQTWLFKICRV